MKLGIISAYPPSKVTLNEYGYYLVKNFVKLDEIEKLYVYSDYTDEDKTLDFEHQEKVEIRECWRFNGILNLWFILKAVLKDRPDAVIINGQFMKFGDRKIPAALGLLLGWVLKALGFTSIFLIHNILEKVNLGQAGFTSNRFLTEIYHGIGKLLTKCILQSSLVVVTMEDYLKILKEKYGKENIVMIPHGTFESTALEDFREFDEKVVMAFGKFGTYKKVETMIEAVEEIRKRNPELKIKIVIAGTDNPNVFGYLDSVKAKYKNVGNLHFTGYVKEEDVEQLFRESTVVVFPYTGTTGSSGVLHQAGSYGKAAVLPDIDDLSYLIEKEGYRGEYFIPNNALDMSLAIEKVICDDIHRRILELANYQAANTFPMTDICNWYVEYINNLNQAPIENSLIEST